MSTNNKNRPPIIAPTARGTNSLPQRDVPRTIAVDILRRVENGVFADKLLDEARASLDARDRAFVLELVYGALRNRSMIDWTLNRLSAQPIERTDAWTRNILRIAAYQMLYLDRVPVSASVNTATELAKQFGKKGGYVNGLLRNLDRKRSSIGAPDSKDPVTGLSILFSHPEWLVRRWVARFGMEAAEALLRSNNALAPLVLRTNTLRTTREKLSASLAATNMTVVETAYSPVGLEIVSAGSGIHELSSYREGLFLVQDQAAQLVGLMLAPQAGETVLDACAAPGGKATHLAELMRDQGRIIALENDSTRSERIRENCSRLGLTSIAPVVGDASSFSGETFDKILVDAPCSGFGVLRRHPDGRWNKNEQTINGRRILQRRILENCAGLLKPGGALVYATCTTEPEENEDIILEFLSTTGKEFSIEDPRGFLPDHAKNLVDEAGFFHTYPRALDMDGFFAVRLRKKN